MRGVRERAHEDITLGIDSKSRALEPTLPPLLGFDGLSRGGT